VVKCVGFDSPSDFNKGSGGTNGAWGSNAGLIPPSGTSDYTRAVMDTSMVASGSGSLRFTVPAQAGADTSGAYFTNFSSDLATQFDGGSQFYVQWRQRFSPEMLANKWAGGGGFKSIIVTTGDQPGRVFASCEAIGVIQTNYYQNNFPILYDSCTGSTSHGPYDNFFEDVGSPPTDFKLQNGRAAPGCMYLQKYTSYFPPVGNCFGYVANEWLTFQMGFKLGPRVGDEFKGSYVTLWAAREGKPSELVVQWGPYNLTAGPLSDNQRFGKVWLLPYNTGKDPSAIYPVAYTWYDELIVSRNPIADPAPSLLNLALRGPYPRTGRGYRRQYRGQHSPSRIPRFQRELGVFALQQLRHRYVRPRLFPGRSVRHRRVWWAQRAGQPGRRDLRLHGRSLEAPEQRQRDRSPPN
jgi:hypothetical protein